MRLGIAQIDTVAGDLAHTTERVVACSRMAAERGVELLVFPLATLSGPQQLPFVAQEPFLESCVGALEAIADQVACPCAVPLVATVREVPISEVALVAEGSVRLLRLGTFPPRAPHGGLVARQASKPLMLEHKGTNLLFAFSYEELDALGEPGDEGGYDVVVFVSGYGYAVNDASSALGAALAEGRYLQDVRACKAWLAGVGSLGGYGSQVFSGSSFVLSPDGLLVACAPSFEEGLIDCEVGPHARLLRDDAVGFEPYDDTYHMWQALSLGLADLSRKLGRPAVSFVYDGTLSSRALAALASDALGPTQVRMLLAPELAPSEREEGLRLARSLRVQADAIEEPLLQMGSSLGMGPDVLAAAWLLAQSEGDGALALSVRDKTALALEPLRPWDRLADLAPLGDAYRSDILAMLHVRNLISPLFGHITLGRGEVPGIEGAKLPSDAEEALGVVDAVLERHLEGEEPRARLVEAMGPDAASLVPSVLRRLERREASMRSELPCIIASTCTLSEARLPRGFAWHDEGSEAPARLASPAPQAEVPDVPDEEPTPARSLEPAPATAETALREALDLLRDISLGSGTDWQNPFSEN